ncbi:MAG: hypothetical protein CBC01_05785 [Betaproteobacteria bacterium TMED41]|nr:MAG: hypothetical protein CBC01_05785 [Betaproteobacteria bacterium TMED41]
MAIFRSKITSLELITRGKVRDIYRIDDENILIITTDRVSAFDSVIPTPVPDKGIILNSLSIFWMKKFSKIIPNHLTKKLPEDFVNKNEINEVCGRSVVAKKLTSLPIEAVVRGFITGSAWKEYCDEGKVCGLRLPEGLKEGDKLDCPIFTPARKAPVGNHDENISFENCSKEIGAVLMEQVRTISLKLFELASIFLKSKNITLVDTKFEFGVNSRNELTLIDEVLTPDSSRFLLETCHTYQLSQESLDKQYIRDYFVEINWNKIEPIPPLPKKIIFQLSSRYRKAFNIISGCNRPLVSVVMGSESDWEIMSHSVETFKKFNVPCEYRVVSAHRMPDDLYEFAEDSYFRGIAGIVAGAGGAAHLPGMLASKTTVPVFGVPIPTKYLNGEDSLYSIVQMPKGIPVATFAIGKPGAINAALHLISILSLNDNSLREKLDKYRETQTLAAKSMNFNLGDF